MGRPKNEDILSLLKSIDAKSCKTHESLAGLDKKLDLHIQKTEFELKRINEQDEHQNRLLDEHIAGVNTLKELLEAHDRKDEVKFAKLEAPQKWWKMTSRITVKLVVSVGAIAGALAGIAKFFNWF